jgi:hypothetical protein
LLNLLPLGCLIVWDLLTSMVWDLLTGMAWGLLLTAMVWWIRASFVLGGISSFAAAAC